MIALVAAIIALTAPGLHPAISCDLAPGDWGHASPGLVQLRPWVCEAISRRWRADDVSLSLAVQTALHEGEHETQLAAGKPTNEHEAECAAVRYEADALARLGVHRSRRDRLAWFVRSNVLYEAPPYGGRCG